jgi:hypothetical protein
VYHRENEFEFVHTTLSLSYLTPVFGPDLFSSLIYTHCNSVAHVNPTMPSLDSIPSGILLWGNATMVYPCACGLFVNVRITIGTFLASLLGTHKLSKDVKECQPLFLALLLGYKPSDCIKKCQHTLICHPDLSHVDLQSEPSPTHTTNCHDSHLGL